ALLSRAVQRRDIDALLGDDPCDLGDHAWTVAVEQQQRRRVAFESRLKTVDVEYFDHATADRRADDLRLSRFALNLDTHRVRMDVAEVLVVEFDLDAHLLGDADGLRYARIVDVEADCAAGERKVRAVA